MVKWQMHVFNNTPRPQWLYTEFLLKQFILQIKKTIYFTLCLGRLFSFTLMQKPTNQLYFMK